MDTIIKNALNKVNEIRNILGLEALEDFPKGKMANCFTCPVNVALKSYSTYKTAITFCHNLEIAKKLRESNTLISISIIKSSPLMGQRFADSYWDRYETPREIYDFIITLDAGNYPQYIK